MNPFFYLNGWMASVLAAYSANPFLRLLATIFGG
jgi:hypothetical protein